MPPCDVGINIIYASQIIIILKLMYLYSLISHFSSDIYCITLNQFKFFGYYEYIRIYSQTM